MNTQELKLKLIELDACKEAKEFCEGKDLETAWRECPRGDWMLWLYVRLYPLNKRQITLAKGHCANTVRHLMKDERSIKAVDVAIKYGNNEATEEELKEAAYAAVAAAANAAAAYSDAAAAAAAANAANAANAAYAYAAAAAVAAADAAADDDAADAAKNKNQLETAAICRKYLTV